ncbi:SKP1-like 11 [Artemisia annua]|uniref:SKP1-like 11 n=1 Tax=Artemisia annua TaxID=35608 RepID=A0A2U1LYK8_ARTAN|nr:SKP1-like 11 [Artemisia annua]
MPGESCVVNNQFTYRFVSPIRLNFTSQIISMVLDFCKKIAETRHTNDKDAHEKLKDFNYDFLKENQSILIDLLRVSCIGTASLLDLTSEAVFDIINGKTAKEIHKMFN